MVSLPVLVSSGLLLTAPDPPSSSTVATVKADVESGMGAEVVSVTVAVVCKPAPLPGGVADVTTAAWVALALFESPAHRR